MLTYVSFALILEELEGDYCGGGKGDVSSCYTLPEKAEVLVQLAHVVRTLGLLKFSLESLLPLFTQYKGKPSSSEGS